MRQSYPREELSGVSAAGKTVTHDEYGFDGGVKIGSSGGNARAIMTLVDARSIGTCAFAQTGHPDRSCILTARPPVVVRR